MRQLLSLFLAIMLALSTVGIVSAEAPAKIGVCIDTFDSNFMTLYRYELARYLTELGCVVSIADGENDQTLQFYQIETFIAQGIDALIVNPVHPTKAARMVALAKAANIPLVFVRREPTTEDLLLWDKVCYIGTDYRQYGTCMGEIIADTTNRGDWNGNGVVDCAFILGEREYMHPSHHQVFALRALSAAGLESRVLTAEYGEWRKENGYSLAAKMLNSFGSQIDVIFCANDGMAEGAVQAVREAGRTVGKDIYLIGVDAIYEVVELVRLGEVTGTVLNDHVAQAHLAADTALHMVKGEPFERYILVDFVKIVKQ